MLTNCFVFLCNKNISLRSKHKKWQGYIKLIVSSKKFIGLLKKTMDSEKEVQIELDIGENTW